MGLKIICLNLSHCLDLVSFHLCVYVFVCVKERENERGRVCHMRVPECVSMDEHVLVSVRQCFLTVWGSAYKTVLF